MQQSRLCALEIAASRGRYFSLTRAEKLFFNLDITDEISAKISHLGARFTQPKGHLAQIFCNRRIGKPI